MNFILKDFYNQVIYLDGIVVLSNLSNPKAQTNSLIRIMTPQCHGQPVEGKRILFVQLP